jgi:hypothetical protein
MLANRYNQCKKNCPLKTMTQQDAKNIGSKQAIKSVLIGILIAQGFMTLLASEGSFLESFLWFSDFNYILNILTAVVVMFICGHFFGQKAGYQILIQKREASWTGFKFGLLILLVTSFCGSLIGFFQEGVEYIGSSNQNPFLDYIVMPMVMVLLVGIIPVTLIGIWFGKKIEKQIRY